MVKINSWDTLPIGTFQTIYKIQEDFKDDVDLRVCAALHGLTYEQLLDMPYTEAGELMNDCAFLYEKPKQKKPQDQYVINGKKYNVLLNMNNMSTAQYIDFKQLAEDCEKHMGLFLTVFMVPDGHKYNDGYNVEFVANEITQHFNVEDALSLSAFFFRWYVKSIQQTLLYSETILTTQRLLTRDKKLKKELKEMESQVKALRELLRYSYTSGLWKR